MNSHHISKNYAGHSNHTSISSSAPRASMRQLVITIGGTIGFGLLILLLCAWIAHRTNNPNALLQPLAFVALYLTAVFSGIISVRAYHGTPLICGLISGLCLILAGIPIALLLPTGQFTASNSLGTVIPRLLIPIFSISGALISHKGSRRRTHRRHRSQYSKQKRTG